VVVAAVVYTVMALPMTTPCVDAIAEIVIAAYAVSSEVNTLPDVHKIRPLVVRNKKQERQKLCLYHSHFMCWLFDPWSTRLMALPFYWNLLKVPESVRTLKTASALVPLKPGNIVASVSLLL